MSTASRSRLLGSGSRRTGRRCADADAPRGAYVHSVAYPWDPASRRPGRGSPTAFHVERRRRGRGRSTRRV
eukprot:6349180-Pyramimonas_sp.AAC.1